jgi:hydrogenase maturation protein HypF
VLHGQVQGVGFRPFVFALARKLGLTGFVQNTPEGVLAEAQGKTDALAAFSRGLDLERPPRSRVTASREESIPPRPEEKEFVIARTTRGSGHTLLASPDIALCADCRAEMRDPANRRRDYAFTNCTNCGPRYTVTRSMPYDRSATSMACFPLCPECLREYEDPRQRRFHAQPNACPVCGPRLWFVPPPNGGMRGAEGRAALTAAAVLLRRGGILALKGLGGFHLACAADNEEAVSLLRRRKRRPDKPFALMAPHLDAARLLADIGPEEQALLSGPEQPIVLCPARPGGPLAAGVAPRLSRVGVMLAYTPLHLVLLAAYMAQGPRIPALVMTSGNREGEPLCRGNREALDLLRGLADAFLLHNRDILARVDDSVVSPLADGRTLFFRRARGYVPQPLALSVDAPASARSLGGQEAILPAGPPSQGAAGALPVILGVGAEGKNTFCLLKGKDAFVSQHIGDLTNLETAAFQRETLEHLCGLLQVRPGAAVRDLHPDFLSSRLAEESGLPVLRLQHHYAHAHALLAEHGFPARGRETALVLAMDGAGLGEDGRIWGGEFLFLRPGAAGNGPEHQRLAHLAPLALPGGDAAVREPWRTAQALLAELDLAGGPTPPWLPEHARAAALVPVLARNGLNTPRATSCGRLFDAVAALLGLCSVSSYEGQAAVLLEEAQGGLPGADDTPYPCPWTAPGPGAACWQLDSRILFRAVWEDWRRGQPAVRIARRFHLGLAAGLADLAGHLATGQRVRHVGLTGGCLNNRTLALLLARRLEKRGLLPLLHLSFPPHDGNISLGQAAWGRLVLARGAASAS